MQVVNPLIIELNVDRQPTARHMRTCCYFFLLSSNHRHAITADNSDCGHCCGIQVPASGLELLQKQRLLEEYEAQIQELQSALALSSGGTPAQEAKARAIAGR
jgi:hypothetical protein